MRKSLAVLLSVLMFTLAVPIVGIAQAPTLTLRGQVVDPGGRGATGMRVELVNERVVIATTMSSTDGYFSFAGVPADSYVVRTYINGQPVGIRVAVTGGSTATALLVLPSVASASPAVIAALAAPLLGTIVAGTVAVVGSTVVISESNDTQTVISNKQEALNYLNQLVTNNPGLVNSGALPDLIDLVNSIIDPPTGANNPGGGGGGGGIGGPGGVVQLPNFCTTASCT